jgi:hypothetical protein
VNSIGKSGGHISTRVASRSHEYVKQARDYDRGDYRYDYDNITSRFVVGNVPLSSYHESDGILDSLLDFCNKLSHSTAPD